MEAAHSQSFIQNRPFVSLFIAASSITLFIVGILSQSLVIKGLSSHIGYAFLGVGCCGAIAVIALAIKSRPEQNKQTKDISPDTLAFIKKYDQRVVSIHYSIQNTVLNLVYLKEGGRGCQVSVKNFGKESIDDIAIVNYILDAEAIKIGKVLDLPTISVVRIKIERVLNRTNYRKDHPNFMSIFYNFHDGVSKVEFLIQERGKKDPISIFGPAPISSLTVTSLTASLLRALL